MFGGLFSQGPFLGSATGSRNIAVKLYATNNDQRPPKVLECVPRVSPRFALAMARGNGAVPVGIGD
jgi:hypothetical protein